MASFKNIVIVIAVSLVLGGVLFKFPASAPPPVVIADAIPSPAAAQPITRHPMEACVLQDYLAALRKAAAGLPNRWPATVWNWLYASRFSPLHNPAYAEALGRYWADQFTVALELQAHFGQDYESVMKLLDPTNDVADLNGVISVLEDFTRDCPRAADARQ